MVDESLKFKLDDPSVDMAQKAPGSGKHSQLWSPPQVGTQTFWGLGFRV